MALKVVAYHGNDYENAVIKEMSNNDRYVVFYHKGERQPEFKAQRYSDVAYGYIEEITEEEYNTFGITWKYGKYCEKTPIKQNIKI